MGKLQIPETEQVTHVLTSNRVFYRLHGDAPRNMMLHRYNQDNAHTEYFFASIPFVYFCA